MRLLSVTACPLGAVYTYMAAEALENAAYRKNHEIKVETQGVLGIDNQITIDEIQAADAVIFTNDIPITDESRFNGKKIFAFSIQTIVKNADHIIEAIEKGIEI